MQICCVDKKLWRPVIFEKNCLRGLGFHAILPPAGVEGLLPESEE
jgi:hypothetical protein